MNDSVNHIIPNRNLILKLRERMLLGESVYSANEKLERRRHSRLVIKGFIVTGTQSNFSQDNYQLQTE